MLETLSGLCMCLSTLSSSSPVDCDSWFLDSSVQLRQSHFNIDETLIQPRFFIPIVAF